MGEEDGYEDELRPAGQSHRHREHPHDAGHARGLEVRRDDLQRKYDAGEPHCTRLHEGPLVEELGQNPVYGDVKDIRCNREDANHVQEVATPELLLQRDSLPHEGRQVEIQVHVPGVEERGREDPLPLPLEPDLLHADASLCETGPPDVQDTRLKVSDDIQSHDSERDGKDFVVSEVVEEIHQLHTQENGSKSATSPVAIATSRPHSSSPTEHDSLGILGLSRARLGK